MNLKSTVLGAVGITMCINAAVLAAPPFWESDYGLELTDLTGQDDAHQEVALSFYFSYADSQYSNIFVGTNGAISLGGPGEASDYNPTSNFWSTPNPMLSVFWTDLTINREGEIYFNDFDDHAVITWDGVGSFGSTNTPNTFQLQIFNSGEIIFGYNGVQENANNFSQDIYVGLTEGNNPSELNVDYTNGDFFSTSNTILEAFENDDDDYFDLNNRSIVFTPNFFDEGYSASIYGIPTPGTASMLALGGLVASRRRRN